MKKRLSDRLMDTLSFAMFVASMFSIWVAILMLVDGSLQLTVDGKDFNGFGLMGAYFLGGAVAAIVVAVLMPLARWYLGAALVGITACLPVALATAVSADGIAELTSFDYWTAAITAVALGGTVGVIYKKMFLEGGEAPETPRHPGGR